MLKASAATNSKIQFDRHNKFSLWLLKQLLANNKLKKEQKMQLTELHAKSSFFKRCLVSLSGGSLIK